MTENVVVKKLLVHESELFATSMKDWEENEKQKTLYTENNFLPKIMVEAGIAPSISEVRRNRPELVKILNNFDYLEIKWGKKFLFVAVGN